MSNVKITNNTSSTSTTTGALVVTGGIGASGNIYGGTVYSGGKACLTSHQSLNGYQTVLSATQMSAVNSGITSSDKSNYDSAYAFSTSHTTNHAPSDAEKNVITGIKMNGAVKSPDTSRTVDLGTVITSETSVSIGTASGTGNVISSISATGHVITPTKVTALVDGGAQTISGAKTFSNAITASSFTASSSRKVKENISDSEISAIDLVNSVKVVEFNYINDADKIRHIGFIAEDTDELLSTPSKNVMDYTNCIGVLLKAIQELSKEIEELKSNK